MELLFFKRGALGTPFYVLIPPLAAANIIILNLAALRKENALRRKRLNEKRAKENEMR